MSLGKKKILSQSAAGLDATANFLPKLYAGGSAGQTITGVGFQPDLIIGKRRDSAEHWWVNDVARSGKSLFLNLTNAEIDFQYTTPNSDGFVVNSTGGVHNTGNLIAYCFKGGGSTVSNTDGNITSNVSVNTDAGFSIVSWQGAGTGGNNIGHGLGVKPDLIFIKNRDNARNWRTYVNDSALGATKFMNLDTTEAVATYGSFGDTEPTTSVFYTSTVSAADRATNYAGDDYIAYCFANKDNYQKIGTYTGTGATGNAITTGFEPRFLLIKSSSNTEPWFILDAARDTSNPRDNRLMPDSSAAEDDGSVHTVNFDSNGFTANGTVGNGTNGSGVDYIYLAIA